MEETTEETKMTYEEEVAAARARMDAYASSPETKARHAAAAKYLRENIAAGSRDSSGNSIETLIGALDRASQPEDDRSERWADYAAVKDDPSVSDEDKFAAMQSAIRSNRRAAGFSS